MESLEQVGKHPGDSFWRCAQVGSQVYKRSSVRLRERAAKEDVNSSQAAYDEAVAKVAKVNQQLSKAYQAYQKSLKSSRKKK